MQNSLEKYFTQGKKSLEKYFDFAYTLIVIKGGLTMLKRKIEGILKKWKDTEGHKPLIIKGCRQCGKTFSVRQFARENYAHEI